MVLSLMVYVLKNKKQELLSKKKLEKELIQVTFFFFFKVKFHLGLIEKVQGNNFKTRVYPVEPHNSRQVKIEFTNDLTVHVDGEKKFHGIYTLPIDVPKSLKEFEMKVEVNSKERPFSDTKTKLEFSLDEKYSKYVSTIKKESEIENGMLIVVPNVYEKCTIVEKGIKNPEEFYFCICDLRFFLFFLFNFFFIFFFNWI